MIQQMIQNKVTQIEGITIIIIMRFLGYDVPNALIGIVICFMFLNFIAEVVNKKINSIVSNKILIERDIHEKQIEELKQKDIDITNFLKEIANLEDKVNTQAKQIEQQVKQIEEQSKQIEEQTTHIEEQATHIEELIKEVNQKDQKTMDLLSNVSKLQEKIIILTEELYIQNNINTNKTAYSYNYKLNNHTNHNNHNNHNNLTTYSNNNNYNEEYYYNENKY